MRLAALVLAAGRATRYRAAGGQADTKLVEPFRGVPLVRHAVLAAIGSRAQPVVVVTGHAHEAVEAALRGCPVTLVHNAAFAQGLASTLAAGLAALPPGLDGAVVLLGDMPLIAPALVDDLMAAAERDPGAAAVVPTWKGVRGNPVLLRDALFAQAATLQGDEGARRLLREPGLPVREWPVGDAAVGLDIDEPSGFAR